MELIKSDLTRPGTEIVGYALDAKGNAGPSPRRLSLPPCR